MNLWYTLLILALIMVPVGVGLAVYFAVYKRRKELELFASSSGLAFEPEADRIPSFEGSGIALFDQGRSRKYSNLIFFSGGSGAEKAYFFDYSYVTGRMRRRRVHRFTPVCFEFLKPVFPRFELRPETFLEPIGDMAGFVDIVVEGFPDFSKRYRLAGPDKEAVLAFFKPRALRFLEQHPGWRIQASGARIVIFGREGDIPASVYREYMEECKDLVHSMVGE